MFMKVDATDGVPIYLQIASEVKHSIAVGSILPGEQLPSVRELAMQITVNPNTVAKAYRELEAQGIVETRRGTGTFASDQILTISKKEKARIVSKLIDKVLDEARRLRMPEKGLERLFVERVTAFKKAEKKAGRLRND